MTETLELKIPEVKVLKAGNGKEALDMISDNPEAFDLVLMDVQMPVMDGFEAIRQLKKKLQIDGIKRELKRREYYEKPSVKKRRKQAEARRKLRKFNRMRRSA